MPYVKNDIYKNGQDNAYQDKRHYREKEREVIFLDNNIAGHFPQKRDMLMENE